VSKRVIRRPRKPHFSLSPCAMEPTQNVECVTGWSSQWSACGYCKVKCYRAAGQGRIWCEQDHRKRFPKPSKYRAVSVVVDGHRFPSQKEADYYGSLMLQVKSGAIRFVACQPVFPLGAVGEYRGDFLVVNNDGIVRVIDVKGVKTDVYKMKKKLVEERYPVRIEEC
jgi:hypothetical protein